MIEPKTQDSNLGQTLFKYRDYTPIPLILITLIAAKPNVASATLGTLVCCFGELVRIYSVAFIGSISRTRKSSLGHQLITNGPFKFVRNPLYCGNFFIVMGLAIYSGQFWISILTAALFCFQYHFIVAYEEGLLETQFGLDYKDYKARVPAWFPNVVPALSKMDWPSTYSAAILSEKRTLSAIAAMLILLTLGA